MGVRSSFGSSLNQGGRPGADGRLRTLGAEAAVATGYILAFRKYFSCIS